MGVWNHKTTIRRRKQKVCRRKWNHLASSLSLTRYFLSSVRSRLEVAAKEFTPSPNYKYFWPNDTIAEHTTKMFTRSDWKILWKKLQDSSTNQTSMCYFTQKWSNLWEKLIDLTDLLGGIKRLPELKTSFFYTKQTVCGNYSTSSLLIDHLCISHSARHHSTTRRMALILSIKQ